MIARDIAQDIFEICLSAGAGFAEIFMETTRREGISMVNNIVERASSGIDYGLGLRLFNGKNAVYVYTNDTSRDNLIRMAKEASAVLTEKAGASIQAFRETDALNRHAVRVMQQDVHKRKKVELMRAANNSAKEYNSLISQVSVDYIDVLQDVLIANSEGLWVTDRRVRSRFVVGAVASNESEKQSGRSDFGASMGYELFENVDVNELGKEAACSAVTMLKADLCPAGRMPVVIGNAFGGVIFHEACGHSLEATAVAENASVFCGKMGQQIANPVVTAIDDGTEVNAWGSCNIDDEGAVMQKNVLIENGILKSYLVDKLGGIKMGVPSTGSGRRESYRYAPTSRMTNTYIAPGDATFEQMIGSVDNGLYAAKMGGGSVNPVTGEFNFAVMEGYLIKGGKVDRPVRGATLIGKGSEVLMDIDMVGSDLDHGQGMCGSLSGAVPTNVGQPTLRVSKITVGGRSAE